jgi:hypothetical protein
VLIEFIIIRDNQKIAWWNMADNTGILSILEWPVCLQYIVPPIYQCDNQHLLCSACQKCQTHCPTCRVKLKGARNMWTEKVSEYISYPCKNEGIGCRVQLRLYEKGAHEWSCHADRQYKCLETITGEDDSHLIGLAYVKILIII